MDVPQLLCVAGLGPCCTPRVLSSSPPSTIPWGPCTTVHVPAMLLAWFLAWAIMNVACEHSCPFILRSGCPRCHLAPWGLSLPPSASPQQGWVETSLVIVTRWSFSVPQFCLLHCALSLCRAAVHAFGEQVTCSACPRRCVCRRGGGCGGRAHRMWCLQPDDST